MMDIGSRARTLPAPPHIVWGSLVEPRRPNARPWLNLLSDETEPKILAAEEPATVVWSSLWPNRPGDQVRFELRAADGGTLLRFTLLAAGQPPDPSKLGHMRHRMNKLLFADLRYSYGQ
ncbi:hypothetical protein GPX89_09990 [Nocardia sp. ET3-3]|uniref:SRPBCC domain-containing protein n=1 Tax=Nocardia terrae TaxID=2675851 RepID=A0A7K1UTS4_9NOCA|nr:hypothetical protein [Nocardia terrae]MVU77569.1 hypothetical protein [Nocardia terrae]